MGRSPDRLSSSYHPALSKNSSPAHQMSVSCSGDIPTSIPVMNRPFDSPHNRKTSKPANQSLEAASKMVPVPESLMSPDYQDPMYDIQRSIPKCTNSNSSPSSNGSLHEDKAKTTVKNLKGSPRLPKSASSSPKLKSKMEQRKGSLTNAKDDRPVNGMKDQIESDKRLTCDMEATKAALESERKIQQLQMQAINALWKKVSTLQACDAQKKSSDSEDNTDVLRQLTETCFSLQAQVVELQGCMQEVLRAVSGKSRAEPVATQTDITAVATPHEDRSAWLRRPQTLSLSAASAPEPPAPPALPVPPAVSVEREQV
ncbi:putative phosphatasepp1 regulatory subunit [Operophtera brumata]|uniref:Putative phosphatasepp1 regulatory subunit n=1 Tax=Operophtera brumata TaxID=104452 RepID=A0A0L7KLW2_OPEBR|nr:putative phosphatasepp1 regulatory subunit [Operophtera brumata]